MTLANMRANGVRTLAVYSDFRLQIGPSKEFPGIAVSAVHRHFCGMGQGLFHDLPADCTCLGEGPAPVSSVPRVGSMPELVTY
jgi:hypothetical protein